MAIELNYTQYLGVVPEVLEEHGAFDKPLIAVKLASNSRLKRSLQQQVEVYETANGTRLSARMIVSYTAADVAKVEATFGELKLLCEESIVVVDGRSDNKPSGSRAWPWLQH